MFKVRGSFVGKGAEGPLAHGWAVCGVKQLHHKARHRSRLPSECFEIHISVYTFSQFVVRW